MSPPPSATADRVIDPKIWRACAGASVQIPTLFSRVYYYPQGHVEHCCPSSSLISSSSAVTCPIPCVVSSINLLADPITDEVFAHLTLHPVAHDQFQFPPSRFARFEEEEDESEKVVTTFAKVLTASDANNGGGFSVPRYCADSVFPPLDFQADPPVQKLYITDIHGVVWDFRHIFRGTPRRHLLTTGWSKFVNNKKLIAGDSVVFMRKSFHEMFIGVRRAPISNNKSGSSYYGDEYISGYYGGGGSKVEEDVGAKFRRVGKGKLTAEAVSEAMGKASRGLPFEVVYYPTAGWSDFVVRAEDVEASVNVYWTPGMRVKMALETEDSSRITWFQGIVSATFQETWKQLQITWDEPEILQNLKRVNPWQVEVVTSSTQLHATYPPPTKRSKYPPHGGTSGFLSGEEGEMMMYSGRGGGQAIMDPSHYGYTYTTVPAGMQGARHYEFGSTGFIGENSPQLCTNNFFSPLPGLRKVSTEMINYGSPGSDDLSPNSNTSGNEPVGNRGHTLRAIQLFGQIINVQEVSEGLYDEDGSKESSDNEAVNETRLSLTYAQGM